MKAYCERFAIAEFVIGSQGYSLILQNFNEPLPPHFRSSKHSGKSDELRGGLSQHLFMFTCLRDTTGPNLICTSSSGGRFANFYE